jgi:Prenyltransferase and squalene oxidase repeat
VAGWQLPDGHWTTLDVRPPQSFGVIPATAMSIRGIQAYWPAGHEAELSRRVARAREWLLKATPRDTADMVFRLRGLRWTEAPAADITRAAAALSATQRADGGWGQLPARSSDAFATGDAMLALHESGLPVTDALYQRGLRFLLDHQLPDGSWRVETRMHEQSLLLDAAVFNNDVEIWRGR